VLVTADPRVRPRCRAWRSTFLHPTRQDPDWCPCHQVAAPAGDYLSLWEFGSEPGVENRLEAPAARGPNGGRTRPPVHGCLCFRRSLRGNLAQFAAVAAFLWHGSFKRLDPAQWRGYRL